MTENLSDFLTDDPANSSMKKNQNLSAQKASLYLEAVVAFFHHPGKLLVCNEGDMAMVLADDRLMVRRSGIPLKDCTFNDLVEVSPSALAPLLEDEKLTDAVADQALSDITGQEGLVDTGILHWATLLGEGSYRLGVHLQPPILNQILASPRARQFADRRILPGEVSSLGPSMVLTAYADPGLPFAREVKKKVMLWRDRYKERPSVVLIQNHGVIILGDTTGDIMEQLDSLLRSAEIFIGSSLLGGPVFLTPTNVQRLTDWAVEEAEEDSAPQA